MSFRFFVDKTSTTAKVLDTLIVPSKSTLESGQFSIVDDVAYIGLKDKSVAPLLSGQNLLAGRGITTVSSPSGVTLSTNLVAGTGISLVNLPGTALRIDGAPVGPSPSQEQIIYVTQGGSDVLGNGSASSPYATITYAMSTITDALWEKRYVINVGPGNWPDSFSWKAWVFITGDVVLATRFTGAININDPTWANPGTHSDQRSGAQNINFSGTVTLDFAAVASQYGKFYFWNCNMNNLLAVTGINPINQIYVQGGTWFSGVTALGTAVTFNGVSGQGGTITLNSSPTACSFVAFGGGILGSLTINNGGGIPPIAVLLDYPVTGTLTVSGPSTVSATNSSLPLMGSISLSGGAILDRLTDAFSTAYTPTNPAIWSSPPTSLQNAIDRIAAQIYSLNGNVPF